MNTNQTDIFPKRTSNISNPRSSFTSIQVQPVNRASILSIATENEVNNILNNININDITENISGEASPVNYIPKGAKSKRLRQSLKMDNSRSYYKEREIEEDNDNKEENTSKNIVQFNNNINSDSDDNDKLDFNGKRDYITSYIKKMTQEANKTKDFQKKKATLKNNSIIMNRSYVDFEKARYVHKNHSFLQVNVGNNSSDEESNSKTNTSVFQTTVKPEEMLSKEEMRDLINIFEKGNNPGKSRKKRISHEQNTKGNILQIDFLRPTKSNDLSKQINRSSIEKNKNEKINNKQMTNYKVDPLTNLIIIQNSNNINYVNTNNIKQNNLKDRKGQKDSKENENINNTNKFWNNIDAAFDSPKERETLNFDELEEDNELVYFNLSSARDNRMTSLKENSTIPNVNKTNKEISSDDYVYDTRNKKIFSFYNKGGRTFNDHESNTTKKFQRNAGVETISESINENLNENNQNYRNKQIYHQDTYMIDNNISDCIIDKYINNPEIKIATVNNFELNSYKKIRQDLKEDQNKINNSPSPKKEGNQTQEITLNNFSLNPSPQLKSISNYYRPEIKDYVMDQMNKKKSQNCEENFGSEFQIVSGTLGAKMLPLSNNQNKNSQINSKNTSNPSNKVNETKDKNIKTLTPNNKIKPYTDNINTVEVLKDKKDNINMNVIPHSKKKMNTTKEIDSKSQNKNYSNLLPEKENPIVKNENSINKEKKNDPKLPNANMPDFNKGEENMKTSKIKQNINTPVFNSPANDDEEIDSYYAKYQKLKFNKNKDKEKEISNFEIVSNKPIPSIINKNNLKSNNQKNYFQPANDNNITNSDIQRTIQSERNNKISQLKETLNATSKTSYINTSNNFALPHFLNNETKEKSNKYREDSNVIDSNNNISDIEDNNFQSKLITEKNKRHVMFNINQSFKKPNVSMTKNHKIETQHKSSLNNNSDYDSLNQLINSVKNAYRFQISKQNIQYNTKKINYRTIDETNHSDNRGGSSYEGKSRINMSVNKTKLNDSKLQNLDNYNSKSFNITTIANTKRNSPSNKKNTVRSKSSNNNIKKNEPVKKNKPSDISNFNSNYLDEPIHENALYEILEEIKQRTNNLQQYFNDKEQILNERIQFLNETINKHKENENNLLEEVNFLKSKLNIEDLSNIHNRREKEVDTIQTNISNTSKAILEELDSKNNQNIFQEKFKNSERTKLNPNLSSLNYLGDFDTEDIFFKKPDLQKLKSFALLLKDIGLESSTFYNEESIKNLEDDICDCVENRFKNRNKGSHICSIPKWNYKQILNENPKIKLFIEYLAEKIKYDNLCRLKLEEKTLKIFSNDLKAIDQLDQKLKKLEHKNSLMKNKTLKTQSSFNKSNDLITGDEIDF